MTFAEIGKLGQIAAGMQNVGKTTAPVAGKVDSGRQKSRQPGYQRRLFDVSLRQALEVVDEMA